MPSTTCAMYTALLAGAPVLPDPVLRAAYAAARQDQDDALVVALVGRGDLPLDLLADLRAAKTSMAVVAALRARPALPGQSEGRPTETRAGVLARAIGRYGAPDPAAFAAALTAYMTKPTNTLLGVLWSRPALWYTPEQAAALLRGLDAWPRTTSDTEVRALCARLGPELAGSVLVSVRHHEIVHKLLMFDVPVAAVTQMCRAAVTHAQRSPAGTNQILLPAVINHALSFRSEPDAEVIIAALADHLAAPAQQVSARISARHNAARLPWDTQPATPPLVTVDLAVAAPALVLVAAAQDDPRVLAQVVTRAIADGPAGVLPEVTAVLLHNPALAPDDLTRLMAHMAGLSRDLHSWTELRSLDAIALHPTSAPVAATWTHLFAAEVLDAHGWAPFGGPARAVETISSWPQGPLRGWADRALRSAVRAGLSDADLLALTPERLTSAITHPGQGPHRKGEPTCLLAGRLAALMVTGLGEDPQLWAAYDTLSASSPDASLGELLDAVRTIHQ